MIRELVRLSTHYRALYCYMILSVWIFLLIAGEIYQIFFINILPAYRKEYLKNSCIKILIQQIIRKIFDANIFLFCIISKLCTTKIPEKTCLTNNALIYLKFDFLLNFCNCKVGSNARRMRMIFQ